MDCDSFDEIYSILHFLFFSSELLVLSWDHERISEGAVFDEIEIAGETDEYPCESIVDVHVVIGVNAEYSKKIVYEFVSFLS